MEREPLTAEQLQRSLDIHVANAETAAHGTDGACLCDYVENGPCQPCQVSAERDSLRRHFERLKKRMADPMGADPCDHGLVFETCAPCLHELRVYTEDAIQAYCDGYNEARRDLAVTRAALAQCATALTHVSAELRHAYLNLVDGRVHTAGVRSFADGLIAPQIRALEDLVKAPDVERAVRVEAAREAVLGEARAIVEHDHRAMTGGWLKPYEGQSLRLQLKASIAALDALTSERRRDGGGA